MISASVCFEQGEKEEYILQMQDMPYVERSKQAGATTNIDLRIMYHLLPILLSVFLVLRESS